jgi:hypothetical protein
MKTFSAVLLLSAAIATPVFAQEAQDATVAAPHHTRTHERNYRGAYNSVNGSSYAAPRSREESESQNYGFSGEDRQRIGDRDPDMNPPS